MIFIQLFYQILRKIQTLQSAFVRGEGRWDPPEPVPRQINDFQRMIFLKNTFRQFTDLVVGKKDGFEIQVAGKCVRRNERQLIA